MIYKAALLNGYWIQVRCNVHVHVPRDVSMFHTCLKEKVVVCFHMVSRVFNNVLYLTFSPVYAYFQKE